MTLRPPSATAQPREPGVGHQASALLSQTRQAEWTLLATPPRRTPRGLTLLNLNLAFCIIMKAYIDTEIDPR